MTDVPHAGGGGGGPPLQGSCQDEVKVNMTDVVSGGGPPPTLKGTFWQQTKVLVWKNFKLKSKKPCSTCCEIFLPIIATAMFVLLRTINGLQPTTLPEQLYESTASLVPLTCNFYVDHHTIAIVPNSDTSRELGTFLASQSNYTCSNLTIAYLGTVADLEAAVTADEQSYTGPYVAAIVISSTSPWQYTIRSPYNTVPSTKQTLSGFGATYSSYYFQQYALYSGYSAIQAKVDEFIIAKSLNVSNAVPDVLLQYYANLFPIPSRISDNFWTYLQYTLNMLLIFSYMWPFSRMLKEIVEEKSLKLKEGMRMMGARDSSIWLSWIITYSITLGFTGLIVSALLMVNIIKHSSFGFILLFFWFFSLSIISLAFFFTVLFKNSRTAIFVGVLGFIASFVMYSVVGSSRANQSQMRAMCLLSPICFGSSINAISSLEVAGLGVNSGTLSYVATNLSFGDALGFYVLDCVLFMFLTWYLEQVIPSEFGVTRKWYFLFEKNYWFPPTVDIKIAEDAEFGKLVPQSDLYERIPDEFRNKDGVRIRGLKKEFPTSEGGTFMAVDGLSVDMFEGEVFALLGHNGAGKTTTISMLTGLLGISGGDAKVFGLRVSEQMSLIHDVIGVCPQQNVLFDDLSVYEHLLFCTKMKGMDPAQAKTAIASMIQEVGLTEKVNAASKTLSGGQKRKLGVAMAFIANPKVVFLDEPTSGMDVDSRRSTWDLIKKFKGGRVIVLTTHFMDEADLLGDRIAVMAKGKLACCGSSLFLKSKYGVGYSFVITKDGKHVDSGPIKEFLSNHLDSFSVVNDVGGEVFVQMPLESSSRFPRMLRDLEDRKYGLGVTNYGLSVTTLEEVFLKIGQNHAATLQEKVAQTALVRRLSNSRLDNEEKKDEVKAEAGDTEINKLMKLSGLRENSMFFIEFWRHFYALLFKRFHYLKRDKGTLVCLILLPVICMAAGVGGMYAITNASGDPSLAFSLSQYNTPVPIVISFGNGYSFSSTFSSSGSLKTATVSFQNTSNTGWTDYQNEAGNLTTPYFFPGYFAFSSASSNVSNYATSTRAAFAKEVISYASTQKNSMYGAYLDACLSVSQCKYVVYANGTGLHALPTYVNALSNAIIKKAAGDSNSIQTSTYPLPQTARMKKATETANSFLLLFLFEFGTIFIPATQVVHIVLERQSKAKHQQLISGVSIPAYWLSHFAFDFACYLIPFSLIMILFKIYGSAKFLGSDFGATFLLYLGFGFSITPLVYLVSNLFVNPLSARVTVMILAFITGPIFPVVSYILSLIPLDSTKSVNNGLMPFFRAFPSFNLGHGLVFMASRTDGSGQSAWDSDIAGKDIIYLFWTGFVYISCVIIYEYLVSVPLVASKIRQFIGIEKDVPFVQETEDADVLEEKTKMINGEKSNEAIQVKGLRKVYGFLERNRKLAVKDLWFSIPKGECFGFLGINGAGKTTTLEILAGDIFPTKGGATLGGFDIMSQQIQVRRLIGYCPQFDAILSLLTAREHLELFARIKGVKEQNLKSIVDGMLHYLSLEEYANRPAGTYSGGNKRKLSVAMALIGDPEIVFLDGECFKTFQIYC
eukprot:TRINITY_DN3093_c0_g1_i4.p1 TRINITY_DN3093_c0_g1~~TRINITY_DN3093_c0_g1_i4.p1  ORF type:complete len:1562 (-),score=428.94 TRINITY_DN3093_c0_g1_i4:659-5344(-)